MWNTPTTKDKGLGSNAIYIYIRTMMDSTLRSRHNNTHERVMYHRIQLEHYIRVMVIDLGLG